jgi:multicomponent Na+:H+ antiporter subunit D
MTIAEFILANAPALLVIVPLFGAFLCPLIGKISARVRNLWVGGIMLIAAIIAFILAYQVFSGGTVLYVFGATTSGLTVPPDSGGIPIRIIFTVDAMSAFMDIICAIVGLSVILYSLTSEARQSGLEGYYTLFLLMITGVFGMVSTGDFFNFFVFLEILSLASAGIIAYRVDGGLSIEAAIKYFILSTLAAIFVLFAIGMFYGQYDALNMAVIAARMQWSSLDKIALVMLVIALAMKCGSVPLHFWKPDAYSMAPSSATAFLVVASLASLYGLIRILFTFYNVTMNTVTVGWIIIILGVLSMIVGVTMAIPQKDVKRMIAYNAVSQTGYILLGLGVGLAVLGNQAMFNSYGYTAMEGGIFQIINHALYEGLLFLTAGAIFYRIGTNNMNKMGGLGHNMTWTMVFFMIGSLAIAGIPPFNGFASKLMIYESVFMFNPVLAIIAIVVSLLTLASFVKIFHSIFMGPQLPEYADVKEVPVPMLLGMGILATLVILFGFFPGLVVTTIVNPAVNALVNQSSYITAVFGVV